jgi:hypothetical protein
MFIKRTKITNGALELQTTATPLYCRHATYLLIAAAQIVTKSPDSWYGK